MPGSTLDARPLRLAALIGSLRAKSFNRVLFDAAREAAPEGVTIDEVPIGDLPHYNQDFETSGLPESVVQFHQRIAAADGVLIFSPEYNYSLPGVLKNALDWGSRPPGQAVWPGKPVTIFGASGGRSGTMRMQMHLRNVLVNLDMLPMAKPEFYLPWAGKTIEDGQLAGEAEREGIRIQLDAFVDWIERVTSGERVRR